MKYKALICDIDGTLVPVAKNGLKALPSKRVTRAINQASKKLHVGIATGRPHYLVTHVVSHLNLSGPSILNDGAQVMDLKSKEVFYERPMEKEDTISVAKIFQKYNLDFIIQDEDQDLQFNSEYIPHKPFCIFARPIKPEVIEDVIHEVSKIPTIHSYRYPSWQKGEGIVVNHVLATKQEGVYEIMKHLQIDSSEMIGIGDGYNDFPLLMACGLKIAMGNAVEDLKAIADYIAPTVEEDGVAHIIEKFILNSK